MNETTRFPPWLPHTAPYVLFLVLTFVFAELPAAGPYLYPVKVIAVAAVLLSFLRAGAYPELELRPSLLGVAAGIAGFALWVLPEGLLAGLPKLGSSSYDPHAAAPGWFVPLTVFRVAGAVLLVPVFEELFLRSFLHRFLQDDEDFRRVPLGRFTWPAFLGVVVAMAITHHRWLRGGLYSALLLGVLYREKRLGPLIWAHAVTNLLLAAWVLGTGAWSFW